MGEKILRGSALTPIFKASHGGVGARFREPQGQLQSLRSGQKESVEFSIGLPSLRSSL